jgi:hypothetical protein
MKLFLNGFPRDAQVQASKSGRHHNQRKNSKNLPANPRWTFSTQFEPSAKPQLRVVALKSTRRNLFDNDADATRQEFSRQREFARRKVFTAAK